MSSHNLKPETDVTIVLPSSFETVMDTLPFLSLQLSITSLHFRQTVPGEGGSFQTQPWALAVSIPPPTLKRPLALQI